MNGLIRPAVAATSFLTRLPIGRLVQVEASDVASGAWLFPVVGGAVGGVSGLLADLAANRLPGLAAGAIAVGAAAALTGALHLDALADAADGLGATTRERAVEIMRDHAIGAFGASALVVVLVLDCALLGTLAQTGDAALAGLATGAAGRAAALVPAFALRYVRQDAGQGRLLEGIGVRTLLLAVLLAGVLAVPTHMAGLVGLGVALFVAFGLTFFIRQRFGGMTGDLLGATAKLAETAALVAIVAML